MKIRRHLREAWPSLLLYNVVVFTAYSLSQHLLGRLALSGVTRDGLASVISFMALILTFAVESWLRYPEVRAPEPRPEVTSQPQ